MAKTFFITVRQVVLPVGCKEKELARRAAGKLGIPHEDIISWQPVRRSLDARKRRGRSVYVYHMRLELPGRLRKELRKAGHRDVVFEPNQHHLSLELTDPSPHHELPRPVVVGAGPAGLFAALRLARAGWRPVVLERGDGLARRRETVGSFWRVGNLDPESNVLFGLGGAGLFSDGKLNTRHKNRAAVKEILDVLVEHGAPEATLLEAEPHVGSDLLADVVDNIARQIETLGGELRYRHRVTGLHFEGGALRQVQAVHDGRSVFLDTAACVLAVGHSARDVYEMLDHTGISLAVKPFAIGLRVEMPQEMVDASQHRRAGPIPEAARFRMSRPPNERSLPCYTFCMCPGGQVIACASEPERLCVNGMSYHARAGEFANAAFLVPVPADLFTTGTHLAGMAFQRELESRAYSACTGHGEYAVPAAMLEDFVAGRAGPLTSRRSVDRCCSVDIRALVPRAVGDSLAEAIPDMLSKMTAVDQSAVLVYGIETRTSSPVRIIRDDSWQCEGRVGVFPVGEGAGYAGGIVTSAVDGWQAALYLMRQCAGGRETKQGAS